MNDETVEASYEAGGTNEQYQEKPKIALTFDDGPHPSSTPVLLDGLAGRNVKVTFFVIGENVVKYPKVVSREAEEGHIIGNHTYSHVDLTKMSQEMTECELGKTNTALEVIGTTEVKGHIADGDRLHLVEPGGDGRFGQTAGAQAFENDLPDVSPCSPILRL